MSRMHAGKIGGVHKTMSIFWIEDAFDTNVLWFALDGLRIGVDWRHDVRLPTEEEDVEQSTRGLMKMEKDHLCFLKKV
jgi:hypothetical protein